MKAKTERRNNKKIIFFGTPTIAVQSLRAVIDKNYDVLCVVTKPNMIINRNKEIVFSEVKKFALEHNIKIFQPDKLIDIQEELMNLKPDLILTCAYGKIIPKAILNIAKFGAINVHASLLPKYRGGAPIHWSIINGEEKTGITLMEMSEEMDAGRIIFQEKITIDFEDNLETLFTKMEALAYKIVFNNIDLLFTNKLQRTEQDKSLVTYAYNIKREDERIKWNSNAINIYNHIRGLYPNPSTFTKYNNKIIKIYKAIILNEKSSEEPGKIIKIDNGIVVSTLTNNILITEIKIEGKNKVNDDQINNYKSIFKINTFFG